MSSLSNDNTIDNKIDFIDQFFKGLSNPSFKPAHNELWTASFYKSTGTTSSSIASTGIDSYLFFVGLSVKIMSTTQANFVDRRLLMSSNLDPSLVSARSDITNTCLYAAGVTIPEEITDTVSIASMPGSGGVITPSLLNTRGSNKVLEMSFIENNAAFVDVVIRPWVTACSREGLVKIMTENKLNADIVIEFIRPGNREMRDLTSSAQITPASIRKRFTFKNCIPISVNGQSYAYRNNGLILRTVRFMYTNSMVSNIP